MMVRSAPVTDEQLVEICLLRGIVWMTDKDFYQFAKSMTGKTAKEPHSETDAELIISGLEKKAADAGFTRR